MTDSPPAVRPRRTQAERRARSEERLLAAAAELIVERGIQRTSLADIGERAGFSHNLAGHLFGSKLALVERLGLLVDLYFAEQAALAIASRTGFDALAATVTMYLERVAGPDTLGKVHLVLWAESIAHLSEMRDSRLAWDRYFRGGIATLIGKGIADGSIRDDVRPEDAAVLLVGMLRGVVLQMMLDESCITLDAAQASARALLEATLRPPPAS